jgi:hypothetical protein
MQIESPKAEKQLIKADKLADEIRVRYVEATQLKRDCITTGRAAVVAAYECGQLLNRAKNLIGHGEFGAWLHQQFSGEISERTVQNWMRLAKTQKIADLEECRRLTDAYKKCGIIPTAPDATKPLGTAEVDEFASFINRVTKLADMVEDFDLSGMPQERKAEVAEKLKAIEAKL